MPTYEGGISPTNLTQFLGGVNFPCSKQELVNHARQRNAPQDVLSTLEQIPDRTYNSMSDVMRDIGKVE